MDREVKLDCRCGWAAHEFIVTDFHDEDWLYAQIRLAPRSLWTRIRAAVGYVFGRTQVLDETVLEADSVSELIELCQAFMAARAGRGEGRGR